MRQKLARAATNLLNPFMVFTALYAAVSVAESDTLFRAAFFVGLEILAAGIGVLFLIYRRRASGNSGFWIPHRADRRTAAGLLLVLFTCLTGALTLLDAPGALVQATLSIGLVTLAAATVTLFWKVSAHAAVAGHAAVAAFLLLGPVWEFAFTAVLPAVALSRVILGDHTPLQVLVGAALGAAGALLVVA